MDAAHRRRWKETKLTTQSYRPPAASGPFLYPWRAYFLGQLLYVFLNVREMSGWTKPVWAILALLVIPALCTLVIGRGGTTIQRFRASCGSVGTAMALYTAVNLIRLHKNIGDTSTGSIFLLILVVSVVYGLIAGTVCTGLGLLWSRRRAGKAAR